MTTVKVVTGVGVMTIALTVTSNLIWRTKFMMLLVYRTMAIFPTPSKLMGSIW